MKTEYQTVGYLLQFEAPVLLQLIEEDPESFTTGRRNDDIVNWFLVKRAIDLQVPGDSMKLHINAYHDAFDKLKQKLSSVQIADLRDWNFSDGMSADCKINQLYGYYGYVTTLEELRHYWIPMTYRQIPCNTEPML
jgi:hypothetical protein